MRPGSNESRNGKTLRGTAVKIQVISRPDSCPVTVTTKYSSQVVLVFLDENSVDKSENFETIPIENIELVNSFVNLPDSQNKKINVFEVYNNPNEVRSLREIPVDTIIIDTCCPCRCQPLSLELDISCPKRTYSSFFSELRAGYAIYNDKINLFSEKVRQGWMFEGVGGMRFGAEKEWGIGLALSTGIMARNSFKLEDAMRYTVMLHGRYQSTKEKFLGLCMRPFIYGQFGLTVDDLSLKLMDFNFGSGCEDCKKYLKDLQANNLIPGIDFSLPISFGFGVGFDIPVVSFFDLSVDIGFRSLGFGESAQIAGFENVPSLRRINMFLMRFGITY